MASVKRIFVLNANQSLIIVGKLANSLRNIKKQGNADIVMKN